MPFDESVQDEIRRFEEQFRNQPESLVFARLADAYRKSGDAVRALEVLEEGIRRHPDYLSAHIVSARTLRDLGRIDEARKAFERVIELDAENLVAIRGLAEMARESGDRESEISWLERLQAADPQGEESSARLAELREQPADSQRESSPGPTGGEWWNDPPPEALNPATSAPTGQGGSVNPDVEDVDPDSPISEVDDDGRGLVSELWSGPVVESAEEGAVAAFSEPLNAAILDDGLPAEVESEADGSAPAGAWWYEPREADDGQRDEEMEDPGDGEDADADLLTRTMADLYARQGLIDEAEAIYRELLVDRPEDEALRDGLDAVLGMRAARGARPSHSMQEAPEESTETVDATSRDEAIDHPAGSEAIDSVEPTRPPVEVAARERAAEPEDGQESEPAAAGELVSEELNRVLPEGEEIADRLPHRPVERTVLEEWLERLRS
jgi:tetratricopeptide (TPR) repeat protein